MTTFQTIVCVIGALGTWGIIGLFVWFAPETHKRIVFLEESRLAMLSTMGKMTKIILQQKLDVAKTEGVEPKR